jgi:hypothetical protein
MFYWNNRAGIAVIQDKASTRGYVDLRVAARSQPSAG